MYSKNAIQCIHSTLFTLLIYDFLQYKTQVWVAELQREWHFAGTLCRLVFCIP
jgi:hypothetical protein